MRPQNVFLIVLPSGAGGCLNCTAVSEARARAKLVVREGWLLRYLTAPRPPQGTAQLALIDTYGRPDPGMLSGALVRVGARLKVRLELLASDAKWAGRIEKGGHVSQPLPIPTAQPGASL